MVVTTILAPILTYTPKDFSFPKRFLLYAYLQFRLYFGDKNINYLVEWMRFMYNLTLDDNSIQVMSRNTYIRALSSTNVLLNLLKQMPVPSIIDLLDSDSRPEEIKFFPDYQYNEEKLKSILFNKDKKNILHSKEKPYTENSLDNNMSWGKIILTLESHPYFSGQIGFILKMAGIWEYFKSHNNLKWSAEEDAEYKSKVIKFGKIASAIFKGGYTNRTLPHSLFERAMLVEHPEYLNSSLRNLLSSTNKSAGSNNLLRDVSWKSFLRLGAGKAEIQNMVCDLFHKLNEDNVLDSLEQIVRKSFVAPQWRKDLVKNSNLIKESNNGYFDQTDEGHRILIRSIYFSMNDHKIYSYVLYNKHLESKAKKLAFPGFWFTYQKSNSWSEIPHIVFTNNEIKLKVKADVIKNDGELIGYHLEIDSNDDKLLQDFLKSNGFSKKMEDDSLYFRQEEDWDKTTSIEDYRELISDNVLKLCSDLAYFRVKPTE